MNELMDRLARANPAPTGEPLTADEQREADALLESIVSEPTPDRAPRHVPKLRRLAPAAGLLAALVIAAVIVIDLVDSEDRAGGIVERAAAAVSQHDVIYATTERWTLRSFALDQGTDRTPGERGFVRLWLWPEGGESHFLWYRLLPDGGPGRLRGEAVFTPERWTWFDAKGKVELDYDRDRDEPPASDDDDADDGSDYPGFDPFSDPGAQLREHVDNGRLRVAGKTTVQGQTAYRLVSSRIPDPDSRSAEYTRVTYLVDARTYLPLEVRQRGVLEVSGPRGDERERFSARIEYLRYEALPVTDENKRLLEKGAGRRP
jgi:hypothetical protein